MEITDGQGVDYVIDAVGRPEILKVGQQALAKCGTLLTLGGMPTEAGIRIDLQLIKGITYRGTHQGDSVPSLVSIVFSAFPLVIIPVSRTPCLLVCREGIFFDIRTFYAALRVLTKASDDPPSHVSESAGQIPL